MGINFKRAAFVEVIASIAAIWFMIVVIIWKNLAQTVGIIFAVGILVFAIARLIWKLKKEGEL